MVEGGEKWVYSTRSLKIGAVGVSDTSGDPSVSGLSAWKERVAFCWEWGTLHLGQVGS